MPYWLLYVPIQTLEQTHQGHEGRNVYPYRSSRRIAGPIPNNAGRHLNYRIGRPQSCKEQDVEMVADTTRFQSDNWVRRFPMTDSL
jgi:hypothetical protein